MEQELSCTDALLIILSLTPTLTEDTIQNIAEAAVDTFKDKQEQNYRSYLQRLNALRRFAKRLIQENPEEEH